MFLVTKTKYIFKSRHRTAKKKNCYRAKVADRKCGKIKISGKDSSRSKINLRRNKKQIQFADILLTCSS